MFPENPKQAEQSIRGVHRALKVDALRVGTDGHVSKNDILNHV